MRPRTPAAISSVPSRRAAVDDDDLVGRPRLPRDRLEERADAVRRVQHGRDQRDLHFDPPARSYTSIVLRAVSSQREALGLRPASRSEPLGELRRPCRRDSIAFAISRTERGFTPSAASPATSGTDEVLDATVGIPRDIASRTGSPKPSYSDGYANTSAAR